MNRLQHLADKLTSRTLYGRGEDHLPAIAAELRSIAGDISAAAETIKRTYIHADDEDALSRARIAAGERLEVFTT